jgi:hypothetical protein
MTPFSHLTLKNRAEESVLSRPLAAAEVYNPAEGGVGVRMVYANKEVT